MKLTGFILFFSLLPACKPKPEGPPSYFCRPELEAFFAGPDSLPVIEFKHTDSFNVIEKQLIEKTDWETESSVFIRIPFQPDTLHKPAFIKVFLFNHNNNIGCINMRNVIEIRVNSMEMCLVEGEIKKVNEVKHVLIDNLLNFGKIPYYSYNPKRTFVSLKWDHSISSGFFNNLFKSIVDSYIDAVNIYSIRRYSKTFCELDSSSADTVINELSFNLELSSYSLYSPPPLPTPDFERLD